MSGKQRSCSARFNMVRSFLFSTVIAFALLDTNQAHSEDSSQIVGLTDLSGISNPTLALNDYVAVKLNGAGPIDPTKYVLFLDGREIEGLGDTLYQSDGRALIFHLTRNSDNVTAWGALLGSPTMATP